MDWKNFEKDQKFLVTLLVYDSLHVEQQYF